jgi:phosphoglycerol transferase MdoB-like AlkP superfamily enzyme
MEMFRRAIRIIVGGWSIALISALGVLALHEVENEWFTMPFSISVLLLLSAIFFLLSNRLAFSVYAAWAAMGTVTLVSMIKFSEQGFDLHAYDLVFLGGDSSLKVFLVENYLHLVLPVAAAISVVIFGLGAIALNEPASRTQLKWRLLIPAALSGLLPATIPASAAAHRFEYFVGGHHASAFFVSMLDIASMLGDSDLKARLAAVPMQEPYPEALSCPAAERLPDVFIVLSETQSPPFNFPQLAMPHDFADGFVSDDGKARALRVETVGGGTWMSAFAVMTGLPAGEFGWQRPYVTVALENRVKGALPEVMAKCGYRTAVITPVDDSFVNEGRFFRSIGFQTVFDADDIGLTAERQRDSFIYASAERLVEEHRRADGRPLFLLIETMFPHSPHNTRLDPQTNVPGEPLNADAEMAEYLRRVHIARQDFQTFLSGRRTDPSPRGAVVLEFGDHQASVTLPLVEALEGPGALANPDSLAYITHFTAHAFGHGFAKKLPDFDRLDIAFLGASFADAAGLPVSPLMKEAVELRDRCSGRFQSCRDRAWVDRHLRRRADSGLLDVMDSPAPGS